MSGALFVVTESVFCISAAKAEAIPTTNRDNRADKTNFLIFTFFDMHNTSWENI